VNIHWGKSKTLKVNAASTTPIKLEGKALEEVENFAYLDSIAKSKEGQMPIKDPNQ
jgi:hypothetical protein